MKCSNDMKCSKENCTRDRKYLITIKDNDYKNVNEFWLCDFCARKMVNIRAKGSPEAIMMVFIIIAISIDIWLNIR